MVWRPKGALKIFLEPCSQSFTPLLASSLVYLEPTKWPALSQLVHVFIRSSNIHCMTFIYSQSFKKKTATAIKLSIRATWKYIKWSKSFWEKFVLNFSKAADCTRVRAHAFFGSYMHYYVCLRIKASFWFSPKIWLMGEKK